MGREVVSTQVELFQAAEERHVSGKRAETVRADIEDLKIFKLAKIMEITRWDLIVGQMQSVQIWKALFGKVN